MKLLRWIVCLFRGHQKWEPADSNEWDLIAMRGENGDGVNINVCKCCGKLYSYRLKRSDRFVEEI